MLVVDEDIVFWREMQAQQLISPLTQTSSQCMDWLAVWSSSSWDLLRRVVSTLKEEFNDDAWSFLMRTNISPAYGWFKPRIAGTRGNCSPRISNFRIVFKVQFTMSGKFEPKNPVRLNPPKDDPISAERLAQCNGMKLARLIVHHNNEYDRHKWQSVLCCDQGKNAQTLFKT